MPSQSTPNIDFSKGLYANVNRFGQPQGSFPRVSNLIYTDHGALKTTDGTDVISSPSGAGPTTGQVPFRYFLHYSPVGVSPTLLALTANGTNVTLVDVSSTSWSSGNILYTGASAFNCPNMVQFNNDVLIAGGFSLAPKIWNGTTVTSLTNTWNGGNQLPAWQANVGYVVNASLVTSGSYIYQAVNVNGNSGASAPTFPTTVGTTVVDGGVTWMNVGPLIPPAPPAARYVFNHLDSAWIWGTAATDQASGIDGPDVIAMSDLGNMTSWNPLNRAFVGHNDGQLAQGGAVFTLSETGIPATTQIVLFKTRDNYTIQGAFPDVTISKASSGLGCVASNTIQFIADLGGIMRLTYQGPAIFDGQHDNSDELVDPIRGYLFGGSFGLIGLDWRNISAAVACQTYNPRGYLMFAPIQGAIGTTIYGPLTRGFFFDITTKSWTIIDLPFGISGAAYIAQDLFPVQTLIGGYSDGAVRQMFNGDLTWDSNFTATPINWSFRTPEIGMAGTVLYLNCMNMYATTLAGLSRYTSIGLNYKSREGLDKTRALSVPSRLVGTSRVNQTVLSANMDIAGTGPMRFEGLERRIVSKPASITGR